MPREPAANRASELRDKLRIDDDDIDRCLIEQPEYFYIAAEMVAQATGRRDTLKLQRDELLAELDQMLRKKAEEDEEKLTETALNNRLKTLPKIKEANRAYIEACRIVDEAAAMKDSYQQRSYMLRELNASANAKLYNLGLERGAGGARGRVVDRGREDISRARESSGVFERRGETQPVPRHRPRDQGD
jgi:hypothetical protein